MNLINILIVEMDELVYIGHLTYHKVKIQSSSFYVISLRHLAYVLEYSECLVHMQYADF